MGRPNEIVKDLTDEELDRIVDDILDTPDPPKIRHAVCTRCGAAFETTRPSVKLCQTCRSAAKRANALKGGLEKRRIEPAPAPEPEAEAAPKEEAVPEPVPMPEPETDPPFLTVRNLLDLLARVPDPERVPVLLGDQTATGLELRSVWRIGGETSAVIIIQN